MYRATTINEKPEYTEAPARRCLILAGALLAIVATGPAMADTTVQRADVVGQGPAGSLVAVDGARLARSDNKLVISVRIPTPEPGSYNYPPGNAWNLDAYPGKPEAYSLWAFVFNYPELCTGGGAGICTPMDARTGTPGAGAFNAAGHLVAGPVLQLNGAVTFDSVPFGGAVLTEPQTAEVHLAIAPHGALQPETLPNQITTPIGDPSYWWVAFFPAN